MFRIALRTLLRRHLGFTTVAVFSLAIAIALNTTMYSVLDAMIKPRIAARAPGDLYWLRFFSNDNRKFDFDNVDRALAVKARGYEAVSGATFLGGVLIENGPRYKRGYVSVIRPDYFDLLGTIADQGRTFTARDSAEHPNMTVLSDVLADKLFPDVSPVGRTITIDGDGYAVIGVVASSRLFEPLGADLWVLRHPRVSIIRPSIIRLRAGVDTNVAKAELKVIARQLAIDAGQDPASTGFLLRQHQIRQFKLGQFHYALFGAVLAVLLVACANIANLQLARGLARTRELALRAAVGASRSALVRHLVFETSLVAVAGLTFGVVLTLWGIHIVTASVPPFMGDYMIEPQTSWRMLVFAATAALLCLFLVGLLPSLHVARVDPNELLKASAGTGANRAHRRRYGAMVVAQIGFALPVLIGAIAVLKTGAQLYSRDSVIRQWYGFDPAPIVTATLTFPVDSGAPPMRMADVIADVTSRLRISQGVLDAAGSYTEQPVRRVVSVDDENGVVREEPAPLWSYTIVSPSYVRTMNLSIGRGRDFSEGEVSRSVLVDRGTARYLWGSHDPVGRVIRFGDARSNAPWYRVIGVVTDQRDTAALRRRDYSWGFHLGNVYRVIAPDDVKPSTRSVFYNRVNVHARVSGNPELAALRLQRGLRNLRGNQQVTVVPMQDDWIMLTRTRHNFVSSLFSTFAFLGLCMVAIGVYGIVAHTVGERKRELAVRISLGATARNILHSILREGNVLILSGLAIGLLFTKYTVWWLGVFLDDNVGYDAPLFAVIAIFLFALAALSAFIPAWQATRIDPVEALRHE